MPDFFDDLFGLEEIFKEPVKIITPTTIQMNPSGIDWTKEDLVFVTLDGTWLLPDGSSYNEEEVKEHKKEIYAKLSPHFLINTSTAGDNPRFIIYDAGDYLSIKLYKIKHARDAKEYKDHLATGVRPFIRNYFLEGAPSSKIVSWENNLASPFTFPDSEIRIYKDKSWSIVYRYDFADGTSRYFTINPKYRQHCYDHKESDGFPDCELYWLYRDESNPDFAKHNKDILKLHHHGGYRTVASPAYFKVVKDDIGIKFAASKDTYAFGLLGRIIYNGMDCYTDDYYDLNDNHKIDFDKNHCGILSTKTRELVEAFFDIHSEENSYAMKDLHTKFPYGSRSNYWHSSKIDGDGIRTLGQILCYIACTGVSAKTAESRDEKKGSVWPALHWASTAYTPLWERRGDDIILTYYHSHSRGHAFVYNTATKTRYILSGPINEVEDMTEITQVVPSLRFINENFDLDSTSARHPVFWEDADLKTLFHNSNVEWILDNIDEFDPEFKYLGHSGRWRNNCKIRTLRTNICIDHISVTAVEILATSGEPMLEQLLKNKLFKIYFTALSDKINPSYYYDKDKEKGDNASSLDCRLAYSSKEGSLKKMFRMSLDQLKYFESKITIKPDPTNPSQGKWVIPQLYPSVRVLNVEFNRLDLKSFQAIVDMSKVRERDYWGRHSIWADIQSRTNVIALMQNMNVKAKLEFIKRYDDPDDEDSEDNWSNYNDYLSMRKQLEAFQKVNPTESIYSDKWYPEKPNGGRKFIYYRRGADLYGFRIYSIDDFKRAIQSTYKTAKVTYVNGASGFVGASIEMDAIAHMLFLHEEAQTFFNLYKDAALAASFKVALGRVKPLEWADKKTGLSIVAPMNAADVQNEGKVLGHCVASFVQPIADGYENVMFIRRTDMIEEPYYTIALNPYTGEIEQIHCHHNGGLNEDDQKRAFEDSGREVYNKAFDIIGFINRWVKAMDGKVDPKSIHKSYGAICARRS